MNVFGPDVIANDKVRYFNFLCRLDVMYSKIIIKLIEFIHEIFLTSFEPI